MTITPRRPTASHEDAGADQQTGVDRETRAHCRRVLGVTTLGLMLVVTNGSSVNVALPAMSRHLQVPAATADWFLVAFMLATTVSILVFSRISDIIGRKRLYLCGLAAFTLLSGLCALAPTAEVLIGLRALQGIAAATTLTNTAALIADAFPPHRLAYGLGLNITAAGVANALGPSVGGLLVAVFDWQAVFLMNLPFGLAALLLGARVLPSVAPRTGLRERFDAAGATLSVLGLGLVIFGINRLAVWSPTDPRVLASLGAGLLFLVAFVLVERRVSQPLVALDLVRDRARACAYASAFFNSFARAGTLVLTVLYVQIAVGGSAAEAGLVAMALAVPMMVGSPVAGRLSSFLPARTLSSLGGALMVLGSAGLGAVILRADGLGVLAVALAVTGLGVGVFTAPNTASIMAGVGPNRRAVANGVRSMLYNSAQALGTAVTLLIISTWLGAAGVQSYGAEVDGPEVVDGFLVATAGIAVAGLLSLALSVARGGRWRGGHGAPRVEAADGT